MLPTFLVIGAQKAATTSLYEHLRHHPDVFLPSLKETNFFIEEGNWARGQAWYEALFADGGDAAHRGDVSPGYTMFPFYLGAPERAAGLVPDARIIYLIRHPVERMVSSWAQGVGTGIEDRDLADAMLLASNYLLLSCYGLQLSQWAAHFPAEQLLVLRTEDLVGDPDGTLDRVLAHLGLPTGWRPPDLGTRYNRSEDKIVARAPVRRLIGILRRAGLERAAQGLGPSGALSRLSRPLRSDDLRLTPEHEAALLECFRADFATLRPLVGDDLDLWGLA